MDKLPIALHKCTMFCIQYLLSNFIPYASLNSFPPKFLLLFNPLFQNIDKATESFQYLLSNINGSKQKDTKFKMWAHSSPNNVLLYYRHTIYHSNSSSIFFSIHRICHYMQSHTLDHCIMIRHILHYLKDTTMHGLLL